MAAQEPVSSPAHQQKLTAMSKPMFQCPHCHRTLYVYTSQSNAAQMGMTKYPIRRHRFRAERGDGFFLTACGKVVVHEQRASCEEEVECLACKHVNAPASTKCNP